VVASSGTVTLAGVIAAGNVSLMGTIRPPAGAGFLSSTVPDGNNLGSLERSIDLRSTRALNQRT
jgi:hypothetical protein